MCTRGLSTILQPRASDCQGCGAEVGGQASGEAKPETSMAEARQADMELWNLGRVWGGHGWAGGGHPGLMMPSGPQYGCAPNPLSIPILQGLTVCSSTDAGLWVSVVNIFN